MARAKGVTTKNVYIEVPDDLWARIKIHCFETKQTLKKYVTSLIEKSLKGGIGERGR